LCTSGAFELVLSLSKGLVLSLSKVSCPRKAGLHVRSYEYFGAQRAYHKIKELWL
jgi:hypothetical protein